VGYWGDIVCSIFCSFSYLDGLAHCLNANIIIIIIIITLHLYCALNMLCKLKGACFTSAKRMTSILRHVAEAFPPATQGIILNSHRIISIATMMVTQDRGPHHGDPHPGWWPRTGSPSGDLRAMLCIMPIIVYNIGSHNWWYLLCTLWIGYKKIVSMIIIIFCIYLYNFAFKSNFILF